MLNAYKVNYRNTEMVISVHAIPTQFWEQETHQHVHLENSPMKIRALIG